MMVNGSHMLRYFCLLGLSIVFVFLCFIRGTTKKSTKERRNVREYKL